MTKIIKEVTLKEVKKIQDSGVDEISLAHMTLDLMSNIIVNVSVGASYSSVELDYEKPNETVKMDLSNYLS